MININTNYNPIQFPQPTVDRPSAQRPQGQSFGQQIGKALANVDDLQKAADASVVDLLAGKTTDITFVVSAVAKADMGFKLLVGVRNKLIEAYKQTMNMPL